MSRIEIVALRDPDSATDFHVFVDGEPTDVKITDIDPGAGHMLSEWRRSRDEQAGAASPAAGDLIRQLYDGAEDSPYIEDDSQEFCSECGTSLDDGEGWDGRCGSCADRAETSGRYHGPHDDAGVS